jgi:citrate lyase beta subunit
MRARRALLYMPGDDLRKIQKAAGLPVDCVVMDLEDAVAAHCKDEARKVTTSALRSLDFGGSERLVRINSFVSGQAEDDLRAVLPARPDGILLSKTTQPADLVRLDELICQAEMEYGWPENSILMIAILENALGIVNLAEICRAGGSRLSALVCGGEDLAADMNAIRSRDARELFYARSAVVLHAAAFRLQAIDMVCTDFTDPGLAAQEARAGMQMGFSGKQIIHPNQVGPVQSAFTPDEDEIVYAMQIIRQFEQSIQNGHAAFALDGAMVDLPVVIRARSLLERARAGGKIG